MKKDCASPDVTAAFGVIDELILWHELQRLQNDYISAIDADRLEEWPDFFVADGVYEIVPRENASIGLPVGLIHCFGQPMMRDRVLSHRKANVFAEHTYRHLLSGLQVKPIDENTVLMESNYVVIQTLLDGESAVFQSGRYYDRVVRTDDGWRFQVKRAIYETSKVATLLVTPV